MQYSIGLGRKNSTTAIIIVSVFLVIFGVIFIILNANQLNRSADWIEVSAKIANIIPVESGRTLTHEVYIDFSYNGVDYLNRLLNTYDASMFIGKSIIIKCNPLNMNEFVYGDIGFYVTFFIVGASLIALGVFIPTFTFIYRFYKKKKTTANEANDRL